MKNIVQDWLELFPNLRKYGQNKFYLIFEPIILGIELIQIPHSNQYRPHFVCYPLWKNNLKECFDRPIILTDFYSKSTNQIISISYDNHANEFKQYSKEIKDNLPLKLSENIELKHIIYAIEKYSNTPPLSISKNSYLQALLSKDKFEIALYSGDENKANKELKIIKTTNWDINRFQLWAIDLNEWLKDLSTKKNSAEIQKIITNNVEDKKMKNIKKFKLKI